MVAVHRYPSPKREFSTTLWLTSHLPHHCAAFLRTLRGVNNYDGPAQKIAGK